MNGIGSLIDIDEGARDMHRVDYARVLISTTYPKALVN